MLRSRVVAWLRVLLPLAALVILSTLFLAGRRPDPDAAIPYASVDAEDRARNPRMTTPDFATVTADGSELGLRAEQAVPDSSGEGGTVAGMRLTWRAPSGLAADLSAPNAALEGTAVTLGGGVRLTTSDGWALTAPEIRAQTDADRIEAGQGLDGFAPMGRITAGQLEMRRDEAGDHLINLTGGVRLIYQP
ncbi:MAG: hypothetical protein Q4G36_05540 [Paracoccus sp. (in: a-proteobacteria)]|nr:hypothetical protein [Paracoccus sp. (in: a-proteobacteria)]